MMIPAVKTQLADSYPGAGSEVGLDKYKLKLDLYQSSR